MEEPTPQGDMEAKREMARRLLIGDGVDKDQAKAVSILEDCVALGDTDAMVMLAKCCALARGMEHNAERAEALLSDAAEKGNHEALFLMQLINDWKGKERVDLKGECICFPNELKWEVMFGGISAESFEGEYTMERVALVMNIVPCRELDLRGQTQERQIFACSTKICVMDLNIINS